jgi:hypothetical protein
MISSRFLVMDAVASRHSKEPLNLMQSSVEEGDRHPARVIPLLERVIRAQGRFNC